MQNSRIKLFCLKTAASIYKIQPINYFMLRFDQKYGTIGVKIHFLLHKTFFKIKKSLKHRKFKTF